MKIILLFVLLITTVMQSVQAEGFTISSPQWTEDGMIDNKQVFNGFGCSGDNISPAISWQNAPKDTRSFAVTLYDPDAPTGSGWWHWLVFNLSSDTSALVANAGDISTHLLPKQAVQSRTDFGLPGFGGPCPPKGDKPHRYILTVFALNVDSLPLDEHATAAMVGFYLNSHMLKKASVTALYGR